MFDEKKQLTLNEIYDAFSKNPELKFQKDILQHRIRSGIYTLKKNGEINRVSDSTYAKIQS